jgi:hypothetical protein
MASPRRLRLTLAGSDDAQEKTPWIAFPGVRDQRSVCRRSIDGGFPFLGAAFDEAGRLADAVAEEVQLGAADPGVTLHNHFGHFRRMKRERALNTFTCNDPPDGEHFTGSRAAAGNHDSREDLDALLIAFQNPGVNVDGVADVECQVVLAEAGLFNLFQ